MSTLLKTKNNNGFTLIESTISIMVLVVGLLAIMQFFPFALRIIGNSQSTTIASNLAVAKLEELQASSYDDIAVGTIEPKQRISADNTNYLYNFQRETIVELIDSNLNTSVTDIGLKKITVNVYWRSPIIGLAEKSIQVRSIRSDN